METHQRRQRVRLRRRGRRILEQQIRQSQKLQHVRYDVRGPILLEAQRLEAEGHRILKLNIGNTAPFGFEASKLYQLVYTVKDPYVLGAGTAAFRDVGSFFKYASA